jgi:hypothetical protein
MNEPTCDETFYLLKAQRKSLKQFYLPKTETSNLNIVFEFMELVF